MEINEITYLIRGAAFRIHSGLGPGLLESVYQKALEIELQQIGLDVKSEVPIKVEWNQIDLRVGFRIDLIVENKVIIELKAVNEINKVHHKQLTTYLTLSNKPCGLLINFNESELKNGIYRKVNPKFKV